MVLLSNYSEGTVSSVVFKLRRTSTVVLAAALLMVSGASAQPITQIIDATGDGVNALSFPQAITADASGNVYVSGFFSDNVFEITTGGVITQIIDAAGDGINSLGLPFGMAVDGSGNVYVAALGTNRVFRITPSGAINSIIDSSGDGVNNLFIPTEVAVDGSGNVFVVGTGFSPATENIFKITPSGTITKILGSNGDGVNGLTAPLAIAVDSSGNAYVAGDSDNVFKVTPAGAITQIIDATGDGTHTLGIGGGINNAGLAVDGSGNVYVVGPLTHNAFKITPSGAITQIIDQNGDGCHFLFAPRGIAVDSSGNVYVAGGGSGNVFRINPGGTITQIIDQNGDGTNFLYSPNAVAVDGAGRIYVVGLSSDNAFMIDPSQIGDSCNPNDDEDNDGVETGSDLCPNTAAGDPVDANGCSDAQVDRDFDGFCNPDAQSGGPSGCAGVDNCPDEFNPDQQDFDGDGGGDACDADADADGLDDDTEDLCPLTTTDLQVGVPSASLGMNRWAEMNGDTQFDTNGKNPTRRAYSYSSTGGCNCAQIIEVCGYGEGHSKFGCSNSVMDWWSGLYDRAGQAPFQCKAE